MTLINRRTINAPKTRPTAAERKAQNLALINEAEAEARKALAFESTATFEDKVRVARRMTYLYSRDADQLMNTDHLEVVEFSQLFLDANKDKIEAADRAREEAHEQEWTLKAADEYLESAIYNLQRTIHELEQARESLKTPFKSESYTQKRVDVMTSAMNALENTSRNFNFSQGAGAAVRLAKAFKESV